MSATTVANWYVKNGQLVYLVYIRGAPGWYNQKTSWKFGNDSLGRYVQTLNVGEFRYEIVLSVDKRQIFVVDAKVNVGATNVAMLDKRHAKLIVRATEKQDFCWQTTADPVAEHLSGSPDAKAFVAKAPDA